MNRGKNLSKYQDFFCPVQDILEDIPGRWNQ